MNTANRIARIIACFDEASKLNPDYAKPEEAKAAKQRNEALQAEALQLASTVLSDTLGNIERIANALEKIASRMPGQQEAPTLLSTNAMTADLKD